MHRVAAKGRREDGFYEITCSCGEVQADPSHGAANRSFLAHQTQADRARPTCSKCGWPVAVKDKGWNRSVRQDGGFDHVECDMDKARAGRLQDKRTHRDAVRRVVVAGDARYAPLTPTE